MEAFANLEWTYDGAFEQLFGLGRLGGNLNKKFPKILMPRGLPGEGGGCLSFDLTNNNNNNNTTLFHYASHTQQKLVSRWGVGKHITLQ